MTGFLLCQGAIGATWNQEYDPTMIETILKKNLSAQGCVRWA